MKFAEERTSTAHIQLEPFPRVGDSARVRFCRKACTQCLNLYEKLVEQCVYRQAQSCFGCEHSPASAKQLRILQKAARSIHTTSGKQGVLRLKYLSQRHYEGR